MSEWNDAKQTIVKLMMDTYGFEEEDDLVNAIRALKRPEAGELGQRMGPASDYHTCS